MKLIDILKNKKEEFLNNMIFEILYDDINVLLLDKNQKDRFIYIGCKLLTMSQLDLSKLSKKNYIIYEVLSECVMVATKDYINLYNIENLKKLECYNYIKESSECRDIVCRVASAHTKDKIKFDIDRELVLTQDRQLVYRYIDCKE